eukprot:TRINITY_DN79228_c0_g1_i1.p1 TRINITY_DN79228_c0_g1~~TRINITY_DN79228_c0_g1_i1.p1  ORF type:complete len:831 (+),score=203.19 TRINITY_DN79228_c0_g1_i1:149-2641(+)
MEAQGDEGPEGGAGGAAVPKKPAKPKADGIAATAAAAGDAAGTATSSAGPVVLQAGQVVSGYEIIKPLGKGKFSIVYMAKHLSDGVMCALKKINIFDMMVPKQREKCLKEVRLLQSLDHPNIVKFLDSFIDQHELLIIVEWAEKGDLKRLIRKAVANETTFKEADVWNYSRQLAGALDHMHSKRIMHRDLKPANIFVKNDGSLQLGDLGLGRFFSSQTLEAFSKVGTPLYMSPEVLHGAGYDMQADVWSLGCVLYELVVLRSPFKSEQQLSLYDLFVRISKGEYPPLPETFDSEFRTLVTQMLALEPAKRLDVSKVLEICTARTTALAAAASKGSGTQVQSESRGMRPSPLLVMDDIVEKLKLLECEELLLRPCGFPMLHRCFFIQAVVLPGQLSQFHVMHALMRWLLSMLQSRRAQGTCEPTAADVSAGPCLAPVAPRSAVAAPGAVGAGDAAAGGSVAHSQAVDPGETTSLIQDLVADLQVIGIQVSGGASMAQLKRGHGEDVCFIINELINQELLGRDFHFEPPAWADASLGKSGCKASSVREIETDEEFPEDGMQMSDCPSDDGSSEAEPDVPEVREGCLEPVQEAPALDPEAWAQEVSRAKQAFTAWAPETGASDWQVSLAALGQLRCEVRAALTGCQPQPLPRPSRLLPAGEKEGAPDLQWLERALSACRHHLHEECERLRHHEERLARFAESSQSSTASEGASHGAVTELALLRQGGESEAARVAVLRQAVEARSEELASLEADLEKVQAEAQEQQNSLDPRGSGVSGTDASGHVQRLRKALRRLREEDQQLAVRVSCLQGDLLRRKQQLLLKEVQPSWRAEG